MQGCHRVDGYEWKALWHLSTGHPGTLAPCTITPDTSRIAADSAPRDEESYDLTITPLVAYAAERFITIVPEIDMPGHTNAALASYPELNCDGVAPPLYTGIEVGFSALCVDREITYRWDPATLADGVTEAAILGVESPLWSETATRTSDVEFLAFPRLAAIAEIGWSPASRRGWEGFSMRLAARAPRWAALGVNFYRGAGRAP